MSEKKTPDNPAIQKSLETAINVETPDDENTEEDLPSQQVNLRGIIHQTLCL